MTYNMAVYSYRNFLVLKAAVSYLLLSKIPASGSCVFGTDISCAFQCHCDHGSCDPDTGVCPDNQCARDEPSLFTWSGESCQIGNVARGKSTNQTGQYHIMRSELAVDGHVIDTSHIDKASTCAHPDSSVPATWLVDLGDDYVIYNVTVFNTNNYGGAIRLHEFDVIVSGGPSGSSVCGHRTEVVPSATTGDPSRGSATITCNDRPVGKYVTIQRTGGIQIGLMTLCEVVVIGHQYISCDQCPGGQQCSSVTGCPVCPAGYKRPDCTQECDEGFYGANCLERCSGRCEGNDLSDCNHVNGSCPGNCQAWYTGTTCATLIRQPLDNGENVTVVMVDSSRVEVTWEQNKALPAGLEHHYGYRVRYKRVGTSGFTDEVEVQHDTGTTWRMATVSGLEHNTQYEFRVVQFRTWGDRKEVGASLYAPVIKTVCTTPSAPTISSLSAGDPPEAEDAVGSFTVHWQAPVSSGCDRITAYVVQYRQRGQDQWINHTVTLSEFDREAQVTPSTAGKLEIKVVAVNNGNKANGSDVATVEVAACDKGFYGANCLERCSGRCDANDPSDCDHVDGSCPGDCQAWFTGTTCATWIRPPRDNGEKVTVVIVDSSRVEVTWEQNKDLPAGVDSHYGYRVSYRRVGTSSFTDGAEVQHDSGATWRMATVSGLEHNTLFEFRVEQFRTWGDRTEVGNSHAALFIKTAYAIEASDPVPYALLGCSLAVVLVLAVMLGVSAHRHGGCRAVFKEGRPPKKVAAQDELSQSDQITGSHVTNYTTRPTNASVASSTDKNAAPDLDHGGYEELGEREPDYVNPGGVYVDLA